MMDWEKLRAKFTGRKYKVGWQKKEGRRLGNCTYAFLYNEGQSSPDSYGVAKSDERIEIELFTKPIIIYYPDGTFQVDNHSYWKSQCTRDRFRSFLPGNSHISNWGFRSHDTYTSMTGDMHYAWAFHMSPWGSKIWANNELYDFRGHRKSLSDKMNEVNANELLSNIRTYSNTAIDALYSGELAAKSSCSRCSLSVAQIRVHNDGLAIPDADHVLQHVQEGDLQFPLVWLAASHSRRPMHTQAVDLQRPENYPLWKYARTKTALALRVQRTMLQPGLVPTIHPSQFRKTLRWNISSMLLDLFGFSYGSA